MPPGFRQNRLRQQAQERVERPWVRSRFLHPASEKLSVEPDNAPRCENEPKPKGDCENRAFQEAHGSNENKLSDGNRERASLEAKRF